MSVSHIKQETRFILWGKAAGRCQYEGCNKQLYLDSLSKTEFNSSYIAHIIADSPNGPRGDKKLSELLKDDIDNLMLMCDTHHRLIDIKDVAGHPTELLRKMKKEHEKRMMFLTSILPENEAHVILYGANIGEHDSPLRKADAFTALAPYYFPSSDLPLELSLGNSSFKDHEASYWDFECKNLTQKFRQKIKPLRELSPIQNYCVFGLAPQPLLMKLGTLLSDLANVEVFTNQKEPKGWKWSEGSGEEKFFRYEKPKVITDKIALVFSLSANVDQKRITSILGNDCSIWHINIENPNNDYLKYRNHLSQFRTLCRKVLNEIKAAHGEGASINIFPAMLPSCAIEFGRTWYPKADLPLTIYDHNMKLGGFIKTIEIN